MTAREFEQVTISALRSGNVDSYCLCYDIYFNALCSFANNILREAPESEEIVQNLFLEIWENRSLLPENISLRAYLLTAVKNDCLDHIRHRKIEKRYAEEYIQKTQDHYENVFETLIEKDLQDSINAAIEKLTDRCREVFMLSRFGHLSYMEIAEKLGISVKTVENQIGAALKILRRELVHLL
jgi:RNA polymerase sigma-70 factor (ECF subfamily)